MPPRGRLRLGTRRALLVSLVALAPMAGVAPAKPPDSASELLIVRAQGGQLNGIATRARLTILDRLDDDPEGDDVALVRIDVAGQPDYAAAALAAREPSIRGVEPIQFARLPETRSAASVVQSTMALLDALAADDAVALGVGPDGSPREIWSGYADQPGARMVRIQEAQRGGIGAGALIAIIDSGIDPLHSIFEGRLLTGWDFLQDRPDTASVRATTDQTTMAVLDQSTMAILDRRTRAFLSGASGVEAIAVDDSTTVLVAADLSDALEGRLAPAFGHGTMVAGIVHLVAPGATLMPLRAFDDDGFGSTFDLIQAIRYATRAGATVINMSFSLDQRSPELDRAIEQATRLGVICVAAAGNDGASTLVYPAALPDTIGVAATDLEDYVAPFSNFGSDLVELAAPGVAVVTTYPGGGWAIASGTSFATPWISGAVALLAERATRAGVGLDLDRALDALSHSAEVHGPLALDVGYGRVDAEQASEGLRTAPNWR